MTISSPSPSSFDLCLCLRSVTAPSRILNCPLLQSLVNVTHFSLRSLPPFFLGTASRGLLFPITTQDPLAPPSPPVFLFMNLFFLIQGLSLKDSSLAYFVSMDRLLGPSFYHSPCARLSPFSSMWGFYS